MGEEDNEEEYGNKLRLVGLSRYHDVLIYTRAEVVRLLSCDEPITWDEYLSKFDTDKRVTKEKIELIAEWVQRYGANLYGSDMDGEYFYFSDGSILAFTWDAWGELMQSIANKKEGYRAYSDRLGHARKGLDEYI